MISDRNRQLYTDIIDGYFNTFYNRNISLQELADYLQLSNRQTSRLLKNIYNLTFDQLHRKTRISVAKRLLTETDLELEEIAERIGYSSYPVFSRAFINQEDLTPSDYRKNHVGRIT